MERAQAAQVHLGQGAIQLLAGNGLQVHRHRAPVPGLIGIRHHERLGPELGLDAGAELPGAADEIAGPYRSCQTV
ncbi:MAG: hypothetical protein EBZ49_14350 [Proteobacteria bacterium]|nr:hypothetical protein [Pseudomonadota bacterium]